MFGRLGRLLNNVKKLDEQKIFIEIVSIDNIERFILDLNRVDQLFDDGVTSFGDPLPVYSPITEGFALDKVFTVSTETGGTLSKEKKFGERYNLFASGEMFSSFRLIVDDGGFVIDAQTIKGDVDYEKKYKILGITDENKSKISERILPLVVNKVKRILLS